MHGSTFATRVKLKVEFELWKKALSPVPSALSGRCMEGTQKLRRLAVARKGNAE